MRWVKMEDCNSTVAYEDAENGPTEIGNWFWIDVDPDTGEIEIATHGQILLTPKQFLHVMGEVSKQFEGFMEHNS